MNIHFELAKMLYQYGLDNNKIINIKAKHHYSFTRASENNHIEIAKWLASFLSFNYR